jgi:endonuclease YncB( thermonuclease family)
VRLKPLLPFFFFLLFPLPAFPQEGLVLGEFHLARDAILDGDTIRVQELPKTLRLLFIDTEETFKSRKDEVMYRSLGFQEYLKAKRGSSKRPVKCATPMGEEAKEFAKKFFEGVQVVRLERDHPKQIKDVNGRFLAYVFAYKDGKWVNYNIEAVRAGMSPYFTKYSYSRRFHDDFVKAQEEARKAKRGIWDPKKEHYQDYDERLRWWNARADFIKRFEEAGKGRDDFIDLSEYDALDRLLAHVSKKVHVLGTVSKVLYPESKGPIKVLLSRSKEGRLYLIFFDRKVFEESRIEEFVQEYVWVEGKVSTYTDKRSKNELLEIVIERPDQIRYAEGL